MTPKHVSGESIQASALQWVIRSTAVVCREWWWDAHCKRHKDTRSLCNSLISSLQKTFIQDCDEIVDVLRPCLRSTF